jgi:hypothetical protein
MDGMEDKLGAILNNPQLMQQIMSMASSLSAPQTEQTPPHPENLMPDFDPAMLQKIMSLAGSLNINDNQKTLLHALRPYLTEGRIQKLEKAMRAAKLANAASDALGSGALSFLTGR